MRTPAKLITASALAALAVAGFAGPIAPPAGPVGPTMKTLAEIESRIAINATNTPGDADGTPSVYKITQPGSYYLTGNISVAQAKSAIEVAAHNVTIDLNGFEINGNAVGLSGVYSTMSGARGLTVRNGSISWFTSHGVYAESVRSPSLTDVRIGVCGSGARLGDCAVVSRCVFDGNTSFGLHLAGGGSVDQCTAIEGGNGFSAQGWANFTGCTARTCTGKGFQMLFGGTVTNCSATHCTGDGFWLQSGASITNCQSQNNTGAGVFLNGACTATNNSVTGNTNGIVATNAANRIDSNNVTYSSGAGISVTSDNNFIVRNTARANTTNYNIPTGDFGQVITNPGNGFVATNPWANFAY